MELEILLVLVAGATAATFLISALVSAALHPGRPDANVSEWLEAFRLARVETGELRSGSRLEGTRGPLRVTIAPDRDSEATATVVRISGARVDLSATRIAVGLASVDRFLYGTTGRFRILTGDPELDRAVQLRGDERAIRALCDPATRLELRSTIDMGVEIKNSEMVWTTGRTWSTGERQRLAPLVDFIERLASPLDLARRIADNNAHEPLASVRVRNVATLVQHFRDHQATRPALLAALNDPSEKVRLEAAAGLGKDGHRFLLGMALSQVAEQADAVRAIAELGDAFTPRHARWALRRAMSAQRLAIVGACLERLVRADDARSVSAVRSALLSESDEVAVAASRVLKEGGTARFEGTLIGALAHRLVDVQRDAVMALGRIGTVESVAPLADWAAHHAFDRFVRTDARRAIAAIQSRLPDASPGQLSIAGAEAGQVSLAEEDRRGEVSLEKSGS
jgi:HEAT repeat protein